LILHDGKHDCCSCLGSVSSLFNPSNYIIFLSRCGISRYYDYDLYQKHNGLGYALTDAPKLEHWPKWISITIQLLWIWFFLLDKVQIKPSRIVKSTLIWNFNKDWNDYYITIILEPKNFEVWCRCPLCTCFESGREHIWWGWRRYTSKEFGSCSSQFFTSLSFIPLSLSLS
jgi:hypothetical protein